MNGCHRSSPGCVTANLPATGDQRLFRGRGRDSQRLLLFLRHQTSRSAVSRRLPGMTAAALRSLLRSGLIMAALPLSSFSIDVRRGSDLTNCSMKCPDTDGVLSLYRICGGNETHLLELWCEDKWLSNCSEPRLLYNTSSGCWTLRDVRTDDSCVYNGVYDRKGEISLTTLNITVQDPELSVPVSYHGGYGGYIAVGMLPVLVIIGIGLLVKCWCRKKMETEDVERRTENGGRTNSQTDRPAEEEAETGEKTSFLIRIHEIWGRMRWIRGYEETPQRDGVEMEDAPSAPAAETGGGVTL